MITACYERTVVGVVGLLGLRRDLTSWFAQRGVDRGVLGDLLVAISELVTNGIEAAPDGRARVDLRHSPEAVTAVISNQGLPFGGPGRGRGNPLGVRGRGLVLVAALTNSLVFEASGGVTTATMTKRLA